MHAEMMSVGLYEAKTYITHHQNTVAQYITTCMILEIFMVAELRTRARVK